MGGDVFFERQQLAFPCLCNSQEHDVHGNPLQPPLSPFPVGKGPLLQKHCEFLSRRHFFFSFSTIASRSLIRASSCSSVMNCTSRGPPSGPLTSTGCRARPS